MVTTLWLLHAPACIAGADDGLLRLLACRLGDAERARLAGMVRQRRRREFVLGRLLLRHAIVQATAWPIAHVAVCDGIGSGPRIACRAGIAAVPQISLAHAGGWVVCAISGAAALGVDIETSDRRRDLDALAQAVFDHAERRWLQAQEHAEQAFYRLWCGKEALFKYRRNAGLPGPPGLPSLHCSAFDAAPGVDGAVLHHHQQQTLHLALCQPHASPVRMRHLTLDVLLGGFT